MAVPAFNLAARRSIRVTLLVIQRKRRKKYVLNHSPKKVQVQIKPMEIADLVEVDQIIA